MKMKLSVLHAAILAATLAAPASTVQAALPFFNSDKQEMPSLAPMLDKATPAVVHISVEGSREVRQRIPDAFREFFGQRGEGNQRQEQPFSGLGSGVIIDAEKGYIVTNNHVVQDADKIQIKLKDGRSFTANKLGADPQSDIALLQIEAKNLVQIPLADSDKLRVGDYAIAIGNPFGLEQTVTSGIVSSLGRSGLNMDGFEDFIQTDAAINRGNSGGALVNLRGELIGINTAILGPNGGNVGIGFSIPSNMMKNLVDQIIEFGQIRRGSLGVRGNDVNSELTEALNLNVSKGAFVNEVLPDTAAAKAGLKAGDVIVSMNGNRIQSFNELRAKIATLGANRKAELGILRDGKERSVTVTLQELASGQLAANQLHPMLQGAILNNGERGVEITELANGSVAEQIGLRQGDIITGVNRQRVSNLADLRQILEGRQGVAALYIRRGNDDLYILLR
ncbi:Do family serine endopeptidase [Arsukibacterium sp. UBA3155]|uniref:Do family serine endopeptidase n=1 Tax=Arsukibacterium sp. UBA3155 TaxID=1946058 RepID=UPI0025C18312|nr:Do family serine endopeptidase [Arsukibacterium sp. UBA3155]|tara:strand:+ start:73359 stop:74711 length:1353 start_codon:yes stop_codon:yes gene_type:complete